MDENGRKRTSAGKRDFFFLFAPVLFRPLKSIFRPFMSFLLGRSSKKMAGGEVGRGDFSERWALLFADLFGVRAAGDKRTTLALFDGAGRISLEDDTRALLFNHGIWNGDCREKRLCVGVKGFVVEELCGRKLHDLPETHHSDARREIFHHCEIVCDEEVS